jgi:hypothetical protein
MKKIIMYSVASLFVITVLFSCRKKDDPKPFNPPNLNEEELITTMKLILTEDGSGAVYSFIFKDIDGEGGNAPTIDNIVLPANKSFTGEIVLLDESKTPADSISNEVKEEGDEHQFFFTVANANLVHSYAVGDFDSHGVPIGLNPKFTTGVASTGTLKVILKHQPELKPKSGSGDSSKGETDIEVIFNVTVQ